MSVVSEYRELPDSRNITKLLKLVKKRIDRYLAKKLTDLDYRDDLGQIIWIYFWKDLVKGKIPLDTDEKFYLRLSMLMRYKLLDFYCILSRFRKRTLEERR